jgi:branched-chain amino acid transport system substrate-binding protein
MAPVGGNQLNSYQFFAEKFNATTRPGVKFEVSGIDNKLSPTETLNALKAAIDQGVRYIIQGNGSSVAAALIDAVNKHNERNPGKEVVYLNDAAVDPDFTNSKCSYWHFRFDADTSMKMEAMTTFMKDQQDVKKVYLLNQNYSHGQQVAKYAKEDLSASARHRDRRRGPASARAGARLRALRREDQGVRRRHGHHRQLGLRPVAAGQGRQRGRLHGKFFTYYTGVTGTPTALGQNGAGRCSRCATRTTTWAATIGAWQKEFNQKFNDDFYTGSVIHVFDAAVAGDGQREVDRPGQGRGGDGRPEGEELRRRGRDAQAPTTSCSSRCTSRCGRRPTQVSVQPREHRHDAGAGREDSRTYVSSTPTSCQMKRPGAA